MCATVFIFARLLVTNHQWQLRHCHHLHDHHHHSNATSPHQTLDSNNRYAVATVVLFRLYYPSPGNWFCRHLLAETGHPYCLATFFPSHGSHIVASPLLNSATKQPMFKLTRGEKHLLNLVL